MYTNILITFILCFKLMFTQVLIFSDNDKIHFGKKVILQSSTMTDVDSIIRHVISTDIKSCINECKLRSNCDAVNYHRLLQLCYIIRSSQSNDIVDLPTSPGFVYGSKTDWNTNLNCNSCSLTETCNNTSGFQQCQVKECGTPPEQTNALYKGNKRSVGSKIAYYCTNYTDMSVTSTYISECHTNGQWSSTDFICEDINECDSGPCKNGATCVDAVRLYICLCADGWFGTQCENNTDECYSNPCQNGQCNDLINGYTCTCDNGWAGTLCDIDIDVCSSGPCLNGATCHDQVAGYSCTCAAGWQGNNCDTNIDECYSNPCQNGQCNDLINGYTCTCDNGWAGTLCDIDIDDCSSGPCLNGATCHDQVAGYSCTCAAGWQGNNCDTNIDECYSNPCQNGQCNDLINGYTCTCDSSWTGSLCDTASCKSGWTYHDYSCYKIFNTMRNNPQAQVDCTLEAAHLVDVSSLSEMNFLQSLYYSSNLGGNTDFWISTNDQQYEGVYKLSDNTEATYFNWDPNGQPDQQYPEDDCVQVWINTNFKWNDVRCDYNYWFCCEYEI